MIERLAIERVFVRSDARKIDEAAVRGLVESIREIGIINPLRVRPVRRMVKGVEDDAYEVTTGAHRLRAARKIGMEAVPCIVVHDDDLHAELAMIDENLMRAELGPADRAAQTARRKAIYVELHPETRHGKNSPKEESRQVGDSPDRFTADAALSTGKSERAVQRDAERGERVCEQAIALVKGTPLDTGTYLDKLKRLTTDDGEPDEEKQAATVRRALAGLEAQEQRDQADKVAKRQQARIDVDVKHRAATQAAEILLAFLGADALDVIKGNLAITDTKSILIALANLAGESVMDRSAA